MTQDDNNQVRITPLSIDLFDTVLPVSRLSMKVHSRHNQQNIFINCVNQTEGETAEQGAAKSCIEWRPRSGIFGENPLSFIDVVPNRQGASHLDHLPLNQTHPIF